MCVITKAQFVSYKCKSFIKLAPGFGPILAHPQSHTDYLKRSFSYSGAQLWNSLHLEFRQVTSLSSFNFQLSRRSFK